jgi:hypothetical protein
MLRIDGGQTFPHFRTFRSSLRVAWVNSKSLDCDIAALVLNDSRLGGGINVNKLSVFELVDCFGVNGWSQKYLAGIIHASRE